MRAVPTLICWIGLLAGCASTLQPITPGGPSFESDDFRFVAPTGWQVRPSMDPRSAARGRLVVYVASQPLRDDCTRVGAELVCRSPLLEELSPGGMFVIWNAAACVAQGCDLPEERLIAIGKLVGVHGLRGEGRLRLFNPRSSALEDVVDLLLNHSEIGEGPLRLVRLRSDRFDPRRLAAGTSALDAFRTFLNLLATNTNAALLPDPESFRGGAFAKFADLESWQHEVLKVG